MVSVLNVLEGGVGEIILSRPEVLNTLNLDVMNRLGRILSEWRDDPAVHIMILKGAGEKAFCAGGDLRLIYSALLEGDEDLMHRFFHYEYLIDDLIRPMKKPVVAFGTRITMGGGIGLCMTAPYRVVSENSVWAMPETQIGFFPDVGAGHFLNACPGHVGLYLALTGNTLSASDALYAGLATQYIPEEHLGVLEETLRRADTQHQAHGVIQEALHFFEQSPPAESVLCQERATIENCFSHSTVEGIIDTLKETPGPFAKAARAKLQKASPLSLKVTFEYMKKGKTMSLKDVLKMDYHLSQRFCANSDFAEGIRAQVIDKDRFPHWRHASLEDVPSDLVQTFFQPI